MWIVAGRKLGSEFVESPSSNMTGKGQPKKAHHKPAAGPDTSFHVLRRDFVDVVVQDVDVDCKGSGGPEPKTCKVGRNPGSCQACNFSVCSGKLLPRSPFWHSYCMRERSLVR